MSTLKIQGIDFTNPRQPIQAGYTLNENEASAFNQLIAENLRNNFAKKVSDEKEKAKAEGREIDKARLQADFDTYAAGYEFGARRQGGGGDSSLPKDPVEKQAHMIAREMIRAKAKEKGYKTTPEWVNAQVPALLAQRPQIMEAARRRVEELQSITQEEFEVAEPPANGGAVGEEDPQSVADQEGDTEASGGTRGRRRRG